MTWPGDRVRLLTEKLRRDFELDENLTEPIDRFDEFRERVEALQYQERFVNQDRKVVVGDSRPENASAETASAQEPASAGDSSP